MNVRAWEMNQKFIEKLRAGEIDKISEVGHVFLIDRMRRLHIFDARTQHLVVEGTAISLVDEKVTLSFVLHSTDPDKSDVVHEVSWPVEKLIDPEIDVPFTKYAEETLADVVSKHLNPTDCGWRT